MAPERGGERALLATLAGASMTYSMMQALVIPALPAIAHTLHASPSATSWTVTGFLLSSAVATPIAGRLGDMFGKRRVLVAVLAILLAGTLLCVVPAMPALIAGRVVQGVSGGVLPLAFAIVRDELRPARVSHGIALLASLLGIGGGLGVILAGLIVEHLSYTWLFWLQLPAFLAVAFCVRRYVPESPATRPTRIDWLGAGLISTGLLALLVTVTQVNAWGIASLRTLLGLALAVVLLAAWARSALVRSAPLLDLRMMRRRPVWTTNFGSFLVGVGQFAGFIMIPQYVQEPRSTGYGLAASPLGSGIYLLPMTVAMTIAGLAVGPLERRFGARSVSAAGTAFMGGSFVLMTFSRGAPAEIYTASGLLGIGLSFGIASLAALIVSQVSAAETGEAAGINNVSRTLGGALGGQLSAVLLAGSVVGHGLPSAAGYTRAFAVGLVAMVVAAVIGPLLPGRLEDPTDGVDGTVGAPAELAYRR